MFRIRRFGVVRTATVAALCYLVAFGLLFGIVVVIALAVGPGAMSGALIGGAVAAVLIYALFGWIFTAVACLVYNFVARWAGGIEVEVERIGPGGGPAAGYPYAAGPAQASGTAPWATSAGQQPPGYQPNWTPPPTDRP